MAMNMQLSISLLVAVYIALGAKKPSNGIRQPPKVVDLWPDQATLVNEAEWRPGDDLVSLPIYLMSFIIITDIYISSLSHQ